MDEAATSWKYQILTKQREITHNIIEIIYKQISPSAHSILTFLWTVMTLALIFWSYTLLKMKTGNFD